MTPATRAFVAADLPEVARLLDTALGRGFWSFDPTQPGSHRVAVEDSAVIGFASAALVDSVREAPALHPPIGLLRLVAVAAHARRRGVATLLTQQVCDQCRATGARDMAAYAWVHGPEGNAPLAGVLERLGFVCEARLIGFYGAAGTGRCPACERQPCVCPADLYVSFAAEERP